MLIAATATIGLALVGLLAIRMTPEGAPQDALATVSTSAAFTGVSANSFGDFAGAAGNSGRRFTDLVGRTLSSLLETAERSEVSVSAITLSPARPARPATARLAVVTPVGVDGLGVTTAAAVAGHSDTIEAMLPSGAVVVAEVISASNGVATVRLPKEAVADTAPLGEHPADELTVVAFGNEHAVSDAAGDLQALTVPEAAPIFDASGNLVGLCTIGPDGVEMLPVGSLPDVTAPAPGPSSDPPTPVATTEPGATSAPATSAPQPPASPPSTTPGGSVTTPDSSAAATSDPALSSEPATSLES